MHPPPVGGSGQVELQMWRLSGSIRTHMTPYGWVASVNASLGPVLPSVGLQTPYTWLYSELPPATMYRGRGQSRGRGRGGNNGGNRFNRTARGLFADGGWLCDCTPRLPAERFKVKKEGPNKDRWFYTCQQSDRKRCGFFLWEDDAKPREEAVVLSGRRTEPMGRQSGGGDEQEGWSTERAARAGRTDGMGARGNANGSRGTRLFGPGVQIVNPHNGERTDSPSPCPRQISPLPPPSAMRNESAVMKRRAQQAFADEADDDPFPWALTGQEEQELASSVSRTMPPPETPNKVQKTGIYATPATTGKRKLPWLDTEAGPSISRTTSDVASKLPQLPETPSKTPTAGASHAKSATTPDGHTLQADSVAATTPSPPTRHKDALSDPGDSAATLTKDALAALSSVDIPPDILSKLRGILSKHDLKTQGIIKGRDISRLALKAKDAKIKELETKVVGHENAKIAELQARIASLEAEREVDKAVIRQLRSDWVNGNVDLDSQETVA